MPEHECPEIHRLFRDLIGSATEKVSRIAERVIALGGIPIHTFTSILNNTEITEIEGIHNVSRYFDLESNYLRQIMAREKMLIEKADAADDDETKKLLCSFLDQQMNIVETEKEIRASEKFRLTNCY